MSQVTRLLKQIEDLKKENAALRAENAALKETSTPALHLVEDPMEEPEGDAFED